MKKVLSCVVALAMLLSMMAFATAEEVTTIRFAWWGGDSRHSATLEAIALYESLNPNIKIEPEYQGYDGYNEKILTQLAGGTQPDIFAVIGSASSDYYGSYPELFATIEDQTIFDLSGFGKEFLDKFCMSNDGHLVAVPTGIASYNLMLNTVVLEKTGVEIPENWDWDDFIEVGKAIHEANPDCYLITLSDDSTNLLLRTYVRQLTGKWTISEDNTVIDDRDALITAFTWLQTCYNEGVAEPVESARVYPELTTNKKFLNNEVASIYGGSYAIVNIDTSNGMAMDLVGQVCIMV